ncbi:MAG: hypothetical protein MUE37_08670 [Bacteroidales bacterium]|jgi:hypothetical protein|nr:hypothetical protein [Bacteroidales bacterium]
MKRFLIIPVLGLMLMLAGCGGKDQKTSGTITLSSELYDGGPYYYAMGLSFDEAKEVPTQPDQYRADIVLGAGPVTTGGPVVAYLAANTLNPPFALAGTYGTAADAVSAFNALKSVGSYTWIDLAAPLQANQVWVIKTRDANYAKLRIISVTIDTQGDDPVATCMLEWVWQPDGSATFP